MYNTIQRTIAAWAFNHYIAYYYFDNVNVSQLKVAFEKGEVELENLPIKKDALKHFNLPMEVVSGIVGKLSIKVPLMSMLTDPWLIKISHLMLIVTPRKQQTNTLAANNSTTSLANETNNTTKSDDQYKLDDFKQQQQETTSDEANFAEYLNESNLDYSSLENATTTNDSVNSEENKLAEFYSSFSATVSSIVKDIYKNIRLEVESMTILFEDFEHGLVKISVDNLLLHRPKSVRNISMRDVSIYLADTGLYTSLGTKNDDLIRIRFEKCNLDVFDEASNNMQLVLVQTNNQQQQSTNDQTANSSPSTSVTTSETKIEGTFENILMDQLIRSEIRNSEKHNSSKLDSPSISTFNSKNDASSSNRNILKSDLIKFEFKLNNNMNEDLNKLFEKNLHIKLDLVGMQYIHSLKIYDITKQRLKNLLKFFIKLQTKRGKKQHDNQSRSVRRAMIERDLIGKQADVVLNKLLMINIEDGLVYLVDDTIDTCAIPLLEFSLEDCRILHFSGKHQQNGLVYAKIGCNYYNREISTWDTLLQPWPFNFSWDHKSAEIMGESRGQFREMSLNSDELANFVLTSAFLDLGDVALRRIIDELVHKKPLATSLICNSRHLSSEYNSIFVLHNETGHRLLFAPVEHHFDMIEISELSRDSPTSDAGGDSIANSMIHKLSINSRSSTSSRDSPDLHSLVKWFSVDAGESLSFEYETLPIYKRHVGDLNAKSRVLLLRVEGWKTLAPISVDKTGTFFREACSDRVMNEDTHISISIDLEESSARKIISVRSPLNLVNLLDTTLEVHFVESNQALYIKPDSHLAVPLPYIFNQMHIRPCNVGVTMSETTLLWDNIREIVDVESKIHICNPITITNRRHASYCTSQAYRICVSARRDGIDLNKETPELIPYSFIPVFTMNFIPPLTLVNLLPCEIEYHIDEIEGALGIGGQQRIYHVDTTKSTNVYFKMSGFPKSKPINIDPGATGSFYQTLEMFDKRNRSLYLNAKIVFTSQGEEPSIQVIINSSYWFINKTRLPLIFKQDGAVLEAPGQFYEDENVPKPILLFSFYDTDLEPPWLCSMRMGKSKGSSMWCDGFKLDKGSGERRISFTPNENQGNTRANKSLIDINIRRGFGRYSQTTIVTLTARYGFDPLTKTPKKLSAPSPQNYKLTSYNHNVNLAERIADHAVNLFNANQYKITSDVSIQIPAFKLALVDDDGEKLVEASIEKIALKCTTKAKEQILDCSIQDIRIINVMSECEKGIMLDRGFSDLNESITVKPAIRIIMDRILGNSFGTTLFRQVQVTMCELVLNIEEKLMLKLVEFISFRSRRRRKNMKNLANDLEKILNPEDDKVAKYYFDLLRIDLSSVKLSVFTSASLSNSLQKLKSYLGLKFFSFEDAQVELAPYLKMNVSRTFRGVFESVTRFYKRQILEQAPRIVGQQIQNYLRFHMSDLLSTLYDEVYHKLFN